MSGGASIYFSVSNVRIEMENPGQTGLGEPITRHGNRSPIQARLWGRCGEVSAQEDRIAVDVAGVVRRLILFDAYIIDSIRLLEVPGLVAAFGIDGLIALLKSGALAFDCKGVVIGQTGQLSSHPQTVLPLGSFELSALRYTTSKGGTAEEDREAYLDHCLQNVQKLDQNFALKHVIRLKRSVVSAVTGIPDGLAKDSLAQTSVDLLGKATVVRTAVAAALRKEFGIQQVPLNLTITVEPLGGNRYRCESNIPALLGFDELKTHQVLERALLGVARMNMRIEEMRRHNALSGFDPDDVPVFDEKLRFLTQLISPERLERAFCRVVELGGLPGTAVAGPTLQVDVDRLLKVRESKECEEFRCWLGTLHHLTDSEIKDYMASFRAKLAGMLHGSFGTTIRWLVSTGVGLMPIYGTALGAAYGLIDAFLLEKIVPYDGPIAFISRKYPSIFE